MRSVQVKQRLYEYGKSSVGIIAWQDLILATCFPLYYIVMIAERPILLRFLNVLTSLNGFIIKRIVFLFLVKYIASGTLSQRCKGDNSNWLNKILHWNLLGLYQPIILRDLT